MIGDPKGKEEWGVRIEMGWVKTGRERNWGNIVVLKL